MHGTIHARQLAFMADVEATFSELQPQLRIVEHEFPIIIEGSFFLKSPDGPFDQFQVRIVLDKNFPRREPKVFEIGQRIPRTIDRHINKDGDCCLTVWEEWLVKTSDRSFRGFLTGPVHEFFLSQWFYEKKGIWRFGQRSHGTAGLVEAYADILGVPAKQETILYYLRLLALDWPKGHWLCPCGSELILRHCHRSRLLELHALVPPRLAKRMLLRLRQFISVRRRGPKLPAS